MEDITRLLSAWLVTFGISFSMANLDGPFGLFSWTRDKLESTNLPDWIRKGIQCPICCSLYAGLGVAFAMHEGDLLVMWLSSFGFVAMVTSLSPDSDD